MTLYLASHHVLMGQGTRKAGSFLVSLLMRTLFPLWGLHPLTPSPPEGLCLQTPSCRGVGVSTYEFSGHTLSPEYATFNTLLHSVSPCVCRGDTLMSTTKLSLKVSPDIATCPLGGGRITPSWKPLFKVEVMSNGSGLQTKEPSALGVQ